MLDWVGLVWVGLWWVELGWIGLGWVGLGWAQLGWRLGWVGGSDRILLDWRRSNGWKSACRARSDIRGTLLLVELSFRA